MLRKILQLLILIILLQPSLTGCAEGKPGVSEQTMYDAAPEVQMSAKSFKNSDTVEGSTGVITDTVVDVFNEPDTQSQRITQAIFNQPAAILEEGEGWTKVKVVDGYTGWIKSKYLDRDCTSIKSEDFKFKVVVTAKTKKICLLPNNSTALKDVVMGTEFYSGNKTEGWYEIALPGNRTGWISASGTIQIPVGDYIPKTSAADFINTANSFKGTIYLYGGVSSWGGVDSSGLIYICSRINGITLPRDAGQQFKAGEDVKIENIKQGDLLFFSTGEDLEDVSLVGIYIGNNQFLHASQFKGKVTTNSIDESYYSTRLAGIRRIFN